MNKNGIRILVCCLAVILAFSVFLIGRSSSRPVSAATPRLELVIPGGEQYSRAPVQIYVRAVDPGSLSAFEFTLQMDESMADVVAVEPMPALGLSATCPPATQTCAAALGPITDAQGTHVGAYTYGVSHPVTTDQVIAMITLQPKGKPGDLSLHLSSPLISNASGQVIVPLTSDATLKFTNTLKLYLPISRKP